MTGALEQFPLLVLAHLLAPLLDDAAHGPLFRRAAHTGAGPRLFSDGNDWDPPARGALDAASGFPGPGAARDG